MDWKKISLLSGMAIVTWLLMIEWTQFDVSSEELGKAGGVEQAVNGEIPNIIDSEGQSDAFPAADDLPTLASKVVVSTPVDNDAGNLVRVRTQVFDLLIDLRGGDIVSVKLLDHLNEMSADGGVPLQIFERSNERRYIASSGLIGINGTDSKDSGRPLFNVRARDYVLGDQQSLDVDLVVQQGLVEVVKRFSFTQDSYKIGVNYRIDNNSSSDWQASFFGQIKRDASEPLALTTALGQQPFLGAALRGPETNFVKYDFDDIDDKPVAVSLEGGWIAFLQHYYVAAWIPPSAEENRYSVKRSNALNPLYLLSVVGQPLTVPSGEQGTYSALLYVGPKDQSELASLAEYLDLVVDYGIFWIICKPIYQTMVAIHAVVGNWGWAIIVLTILIKLLLFPLSAKSLKSMARMRSLQPEMDRLKELYGEDRQKMSQEQMALWKREKVNPLGGCLPMLLQMPVFISLYWVLSESVEIRHAPWLLWIKDLSAMDPYFILPLVMGLSMVLMQKMQPVPSDPMQAKVMQYMPIAFTFMFLWFPSGLVLYWTVNNLLSMGQQWFVNRQILRKESV
jgi:YidC/Oxa1 family membrane protein insertase